MVLNDDVHYVMLRGDTQDGTSTLKLDKKTAFGHGSVTLAPTTGLHYLFVFQSLAGQEQSSL